MTKENTPSHDDLVSIVFENLINQGYIVHAEERIEIPPYREQRLCKMPHNQLELCVKTTTHIRTDLIAAKGQTVGIEVKKSIWDLARSHKVFDLQLRGYVQSSYFDRVYLAMPLNAIGGSFDNFTYRHVIERLSIGMIGIDTHSRTIVLLHRAKPLIKTRKINAKQRINEATLKYHVALALRRAGYNVHLEVKIPKPYSSGSSGTSSNFNKIDIAATKQNKVIGIEVKKNISNIHRLVKQLQEYAASGRLTQLYLAIPEKHFNRIIRRMKQITPNMPWGIMTIIHTGGRRTQIIIRQPAKHLNP